MRPLSTLQRALRSPSLPRLRTFATAPPPIPHSPAASDTTPPSFPPVIFSGIQPTGIPHLGNYLGALRQWATLSRFSTPDTKLVFSLVDLHAITRPQDPAQLRAWRRESFAMLLACGVDVERAVVFEQSMVPEHVELMWVLSTFTSVGALRRMTQWKDKLGVKGAVESESTFEGEDVAGSLKLGLFSYPVLQAADILVHRATAVPVGEDQAQHLELTRNIAGSFNHAFGQNVLPLPETLLSPAKRVMSLTDPSKKMSKSAINETSRILLTDSPETIKRRFQKALTDSMGPANYDVEKRPGVSNLMEIAAHMRDTPIATVVEEAEGMNMKDLKEYVTEIVVRELAPVREAYEEILGKEASYIDEVAAEGAKRASESARETMRIVRDVVGLANR